MNDGDRAVLEILDWNVVERELMRDCILLHTEVWANPEPLELIIERRMRRTREPDSPQLSDHRLHVVRQDARVIAMARSFRRTIACDGHPLAVMALASVCVDPRLRGRGLGEAVVRSAWERLDAAAAISFFQTGVPGFYERLGGRRIANPIVSSGRSFWEPHAMIAPGSASWPAGIIDLLGDGW